MTELLREEPNRYCADCGAKGPRWASWNIGCFLCIRCAGIHRNLGVHISRVKSVNLDSWTPEQMKNIQEWGNRRCKEYFECFLPEDFRRPQTDSAMEAFIRNKYEKKQYIKKGAPPPKTNSTQDKLPTAPQKEARIDKIERPKRGEKRREETISQIPLKDIANKASTPVSLPHESSNASISAPLAKPRPHPHPQHKPEAVQPKPAPLSADLLSLDQPAAVNTQPQSRNSNAAPELIDFGGFQAHNAGSAQSQQISDPFAPEADKAEESLFKDDSKSTKDSIMALYKGTSAQQPQMFGIPGGMYISPQQHMQPQQHQMIPNAYNRMPSNFQQPVGPMSMQQQHYTQQQVQQVQQQLQQMHINSQLPNQQPSFVSQCMFNEQTPAGNWMQQRPASFTQPQQQAPYSVTTGPTSNNAFNMYQMGATQGTMGQTLSHSLWQ